MMKVIVPLFVFAMSAASLSQEDSLIKDLGDKGAKACVIAQSIMSAQIEEAGKRRPKISFQLMCGLTYGVKQDAELEPNHIQLSRAEKVRLDGFRRVSDAAYAAQMAYEKTLMAAHGVVEPHLGDKCWHYVGIVVDTGYITEARTSGWPGQDCPIRPARTR